MRVVVFAILLCVAYRVASADPQISIEPRFGNFVSGTPIITEISPNRFNIKIDFAATTAGAFPMTITSDSPNDTIAEIEFTASGLGTVIELVIDGDQLSGAIRPCLTAPCSALVWRDV